MISMKHVLIFALLLFLVGFGCTKQSPKQELVALSAPVQFNGFSLSFPSPTSTTQAPLNPDNPTGPQQYRAAVTLPSAEAGYLVQQTDLPPSVSSDPDAIAAGFQAALQASIQRYSGTLLDQESVDWQGRPSTWYVLQAKDTTIVTRLFLLDDSLVQLQVTSQAPIDETLARSEQFFNTLVIQ